jgi:hypothetical protein
MWSSNLPPSLPLPVGELGLDADLCVRAPDGRILCSVVMLATLYIREGDRPEVRAGIVRAYDRYVQAVGDVMRWGMNPQTGEPHELAGSPWADVRRWPSEVFDLFNLEILLSGGARVDDADPRRFVAVSKCREERDLSYLSITLPVRWANEHSFEAFAQLTVDLCNFVGPTHGYGGLGVVPHIAGFDAESIAPLFNLARRFRGLELDVPGVHEPWLSSRDRLKGVNWLTVIDAEWVEELGGVGSLAARLGPAIALRPFTGGKGGYVLQAGVSPRFGDAALQEGLPLYGRVARALAPIRMKSPEFMWVQGRPAGFNIDEARRWINRFDEEP